MCFASLHVLNRKATTTETLSVQRIPGYTGWKGLYSTKQDDDPAKLVCLVGKTKATIKKIAFERGVVNLAVEKWSGAKLVEVTLFNQAHNMWVTLPDGMVVALHNLKPKVLINVGVPFPVARVRKPKAATPTGMSVIETALDEAAKTPAPADKVDA